MPLISQPNRRITQKDIAARAGVSQFAVSAVLGGGLGAKRFSEATRQRIVGAASDAGYRPSRAAQALRTGVSDTIGLWMVRTHHPVHTHYSYLLHRTARLNEKQLLLSETTDDSDDVRDTNAWGWPVDSVIAVDSSERVVQYRQTYGNDLPIVSAGWNYTNVVDSVGIDLVSGANAAMDHIMDAGCRDIVYLCPSLLCHRTEARYGIYMSCCERERIEPHVVNPEIVSRESGYLGMKAYLAAGGTVDAVYAASEPLAIGANRALREAGRRIPDDVVLVSFGDEEDDLPYFETPITGVAAPVAAVCERAWEFLLNRQKDPHMPLQHILLPMSLNVRASSVVKRPKSSP